MRHRLRRADAGHWLARLERSPAAAGAPWHYVANPLPAPVPAGAHVIERWQATDVVGDTSPVALAQNWIVLVARTR
jgi:hypothetical protein